MPLIDRSNAAFGGAKIASPVYCQFTSTASTPFDRRGSIGGPPAMFRIALYMYKNIAESPLLIGLTLHSIK
jgi:hypothetical protein